MIMHKKSLSLTLALLAMLSFSNAWALDSAVADSAGNRSGLALSPSLAMTYLANQPKEPGF